MRIIPPNCSSDAFSQCSQTERAPVYVFQSQSRTVRRRVRVAESDVADMERWRGEVDGMLSQPSGEFSPNAGCAKLSMRCCRRRRTHGCRGEESRLGEVQALDPFYG